MHSKRTRLLVDPKVQWAIGLRILCHWSLFLICLVTIGAMVRLMVTAGDQPFSQSWRSAAAAQLPILGVMFMLMPVFLRDTLKLSNRFAGPMYRLRTALRTLSKDEPTSQINFRTGDFWQEAAADFNLVLEKIETLERENASLKAQLSATQEHASV